MKAHAARNSALALLGLVSLSIYILACTSFSPDDSKVLYPTFDPKTGATGVSVYDRASGKSELLFLPAGVDVAKVEPKAALCRAQWLPDGKSVVVAWPVAGTNGEAGNDGLNIEVLPFNRSGPARLFSLPGLSGGANRLARPLVLGGIFLFLEAESNSFIRVNLATGQIHHQSSKNEMLLLPAPGGDRLFYLAAGDSTNAPVEFGTLNPDTFARSPWYRISSSDFDNSTSDFIVSRDGRRLAYFTGNDKPLLRAFESGQPLKTLPLAGRETLLPGYAKFSPSGDVLYASYMATGAGQTNAEFGFLEIPMDGAAVRRTTLIRDVEKPGDSSPLFFQLDVAHNGKALAVASTYLAVDHPLKPGDCALFLVDLTGPQRKVTKALIPQPTRSD